MEHQKTLSEINLSPPENLPKKVEINFKKCQWYSKKTPKEEKQKTPEKNIRPQKTPEKNIRPQRKAKANKKYFLEDSPSPKKKHVDSPSPKKKRLSSSNIFKSRKYLSPSAKLEMKIPKVSDLLKAGEEQRKLKEIDEFIKKSSSQFLKELTCNEVESQEKPKLNRKDCTKLTLLQLQRRFKKDSEFLDGIFNGIIYSERHELFKKQETRENNSLKEDLRVSESLGVFTSEQLVFLVSLFRERYDNGNKYKYSDYYFKVLLPEYCLKIFMDYHKMTHQSALDYLKNVPVPDLFGIM